MQVKYVWTYNGRILVRHKDRAKVHEINSLHDLAEVEKYMAHFQEQIREDKNSSTSQQQERQINSESTIAASATSESPTMVGSKQISSPLTASPSSRMETDKFNTSTNVNNPKENPSYNPLQNSILN